MAADACKKAAPALAPSVVAVLRVSAAMDGTEPVRSLLCVAQPLVSRLPCLPCKMLLTHNT